MEKYFSALITFNFIALILYSFGRIHSKYLIRDLSNLRVLGSITPFRARAIRWCAQRNLSMPGSGDYLQTKF